MMMMLNIKSPTKNKKITTIFDLSEQHVTDVVRLYMSQWRGGCDVACDSKVVGVVGVMLQQRKVRGGQKCNKCNEIHVN